MNVDSFERETTRVATLTLPHSVMRAFGIASAYRRISSGDGVPMGVGGFDYDRNREAEFAERRHIPKAELLQLFDDMVAKAEQTFNALTPERLGDASPEPKMYTVVVQDLIGIATHLANHAGQILWIT